MIVLSPVQPENAELSMLPLIRVTLISDVQPEKAFEPMPVIPCGTEMLVSALHPMNAESSIDGVPC